MGSKFLLTPELSVPQYVIRITTILRKILIKDKICNNYSNGNAEAFHKQKAMWLLC